MKFTRARARGEEPEREPEQNLFALFANRSRIVPKSLDFGNKRTFEVIITVRFASDQPAGEWDRGLINQALRPKIAQILRAILENEYPDWQIRVELASKYNGRE